MTIKEFILQNTITALEERLNRLIEIGAPEIVISNLSSELEGMKQGNIKIGGNTEKLERELPAWKQRKGRGGKPYIAFADGTCYFPTAKYGRYIK